MSDIFPVGRLRSDFPILSREIYGKKLVYLDNTASTRTRDRLWRRSRICIIFIRPMSTGVCTPYRRKPPR